MGSSTSRRFAPCTRLCTNHSHLSLKALGNRSRRGRLTHCAAPVLLPRGSTDAPPPSQLIGIMGCSLLHCKHMLMDRKSRQLIGIVMYAYSFFNLCTVALFRR